MTYRNDHDAAIARVDALEHENQKLAIENAKLKTPKPLRPLGSVVGSSWKQPAIAIGMLAILCGAAAATWILFLGKQSSAADEEKVGAIDDRLAELAHDRLSKCALQLAPNPRLDETRTDPRGAAPISIDAIKRTTGCRRELDVFLAESIISGTERAALQKWLSAEDQLDSAVTMLVTYYGSDPYVLDGYTSARQLWLEYDRAYFQRDISLDGWRSAR